jgi:predicted metal-dependent hydrolase
MQQKNPSKIIIIGEREICYTVRKSKRAGRIRITVGHDLGVVVTVPRFSPEILAHRFVAQKAVWILRSLEKIKKRGITPKLKGSRRDFILNKASAHRIAREKIKKFNDFYNFKYAKINIRNQKTRWGSCSKNGNLSFNYKIVFLPDHLADYLVVHELCHLGEMNHSQRFWNLVAKTIPDYGKMRRELRKCKV